VPLEDVRRFEAEFLEYLRREQGGLLETIRETREFSDETAETLDDAYTTFTEQFETSEGGAIHVGREDHEALEDEDVEQEQIVKQKRG
jgi:F-type H+/Na+-transporting ATPase subunit alpha